MDLSVRRWSGYGGLLFFVLLAVSIFIAPSTPSANATAAKVVSSYHNHRGVYYASAYITVVAIVVGLTYLWYLREYLVAQAPASRRLTTVAFAGGVIWAVQGAVGAGLNFALANGSNKSNLAGSSMQALNLLNNDLNPMIAAAGTATFLIVTGVVVVRNGGLPGWLGWVAIVFGVISVAGFLGGAPAGVWVLIASIAVIVRNRGTGVATASTRTTSPIATEG